MNKNILIAPLNWGLGHATRCIPIIKALEEKRDKEIEEIKMKYKKRIDYIKNAILYKGLSHN